MKNILLLICLLFFTNCNSGPRKITEEDLINRVLKNDLPKPGEVKIFNLEGSELSLDSVAILEKTGKYYGDIYVNSKKEIVKIVLRPSTKEDEELVQRINKKLNEGPQVLVRDVNCEEIASLLQVAYEKDQEMRKDGNEIDYDLEYENLEVVVNILEKCGMPTLEQVNEIQMSGIWLVLQHAPPEYQSKYIPLLEQAAERGDISKRVIALMKDRALMDEGEPQIYGTQLLNGELHELFEPEFVDQRREEIGMGPLKEYLARFGVEFNIEKQRR